MGWVDIGTQRRVVLVRQVIILDCSGSHMGKFLGDRSLPGLGQANPFGIICPGTHCAWVARCSVKASSQLPTIRHGKCMKQQKQKEISEVQEVRELCTLVSNVDHLND